MCIRDRLITLNKDFELIYKNQILRKQTLLSKIHAQETSWMRQYEFNNLPFTLLPQEEDTGSVLHPIISDLVFTPAGSFDVTNITLLSTGTFVLLAIIIFIICFKCDRLRSSSWQLLTGCWEKFFMCVTSRSFRAKRDNRRLRLSLIHISEPTRPY